MIQFVPLLQTVLWVGLIVWLIFRYNKQVEAILTAIQGRITRGSSVKAGPFELGQEIRPQDVQEQSKRIEEEVQELEAAAVQVLPDATPESARRTQNSFRRRYLLAEDLVMRELQSEFGVVINRSVRFANFQLDGIFAKDGGGFGIEVKYVSRRIAFDRLLSSLANIHTALQRLGWRRFTLILVLVCETDDVVSPSDIERIQSRASELGITIITRVYTLRALADKFGIESQDADNA
jgi:hypothetical protein